MNNYEKILYNPLLLAILAGFMVGNIPLALVTGGVTILIWGMSKGKNYIIITTILLVSITGNINFEIIYLFVLSLIWMINTVIDESKDTGKMLFVFSIISILVFPLWKGILGLVPAQLLNEFNIAGELLLLAAILLNFERGIKKEKERTGYLLYTFLAGLSIKANIFAVPFIIIAIAFDIYLNNRDYKVIIKDRVYYTMLLTLSLIFIYFFIPINIFIISAFTLLLIYIYLRQEKTVMIETVYLSILVGLIGGKIGLLN